MDGNGIDLIARNDLQEIHNGIYDSDRNGKANSAIHFSYGYALIPPDVYFDPATGGFTFMVWFKMSSLEGWQRLIDVGTHESGAGQNIYVAKYYGSPELYIRIKNSHSITHNYVFAITTNTWYHLAMSLSQTQSKISYFLNGANLIIHPLTGEFSSMFYIIGIYIRHFI